MFKIRIEKKINKKTNKPLIEITTKDNRNFKFCLLDSNENKILNILQSHCFPQDQYTYGDFAREYKKKISKNNIYREGWNIFDIKKEFKRQNIDFLTDVIFFFK